MDKQLVLSHFLCLHFSLSVQLAVLGIVSDFLKGFIGFVLLLSFESLVKISELGVCLGFSKAILVFEGLICAFCRLNFDSCCDMFSF